jgi:hypothetical protein
LGGFGVNPPLPNYEESAEPIDGSDACVRHSSRRAGVAPSLAQINSTFGKHMQLSFKSPVADRVTFLTSYSKEINNRILPWWIRQLLGVALWVVIAVVTDQITQDGERTIKITMCFVAIIWLWQKGMAFLNRKMAARYFSALPDAELSSCLVKDGRFITENRGLIHSFPLVALSTIDEQSDALYFDFPTLGRVRIPVSAFASPSERAEFVRKVNELKIPNQSTDPTLSPGTPAVAQDSPLP